MLKAHKSSISSQHVLIIINNPNAVKLSRTKNIRIIAYTSILSIPLVSLELVNLERILVAYICGAVMNGVGPFFHVLRIVSIYRV